MPSCEDHGQRILNDRSRPRCDAFHRSPRSNFVDFRLPYRFYLTFIDLKQFALRLDRLPGLIRGKRFRRNSPSQGNFYRAQVFCARILALTIGSLNHELAPAIKKKRQIQRMEEESNKFWMTLESKLLWMEWLFWDWPDWTLALFSPWGY